MKRLLIALAILAAPTIASAQGCFFMAQVKATKAADDKTIYAQVRGKLYRFDMAAPCPGLATGGYAVGLQGHDSVCNASQLRVTLKASKQQCPVGKITILTDAQAKALPANLIPKVAVY